MLSMLLNNVKTSCRIFLRHDAHGDVGLLCLSAITKNNADTEYQKGNYQQAIRDYELLKNGASAGLLQSGQYLLSLQTILPGCTQL